MNKVYDVLVVGGATSGAYFAYKMAKMGYSVKVIEKLNRENLGRKMDIFHVSKGDFPRFDIPVSVEGDDAWAFEFTDNGFSSPSNKYTVSSKSETVGLHMHEYTLLMVDRAIKSGVDFEYEASFSEFIFENGVICGARYKSGRSTKKVYSRVVVDCSGSAAVARSSLPKGYGVENFKISEEDLFYVILRYVKFSSPRVNTFWLNTKSWYAPYSMDPTEKIIGTGATRSYDRAKADAARLDSVSLTGDYEVIKTEMGTTPYRRPPYSLVADNFIVAGDSACLTKPECGEGVTSSMVMIDIAARVLDGAFKQNDTSKEKLWKINCEYNTKQGADFSLVRAFLTKLVNNATDDELEYCFSHGIIFNSKFLGEDNFYAKDVVKTITSIIAGISTKHISGKTIFAVMSGAKLGFELRQHYLSFPESVSDYDIWCQKAQKLWDKVGKVK